LITIKHIVDICPLTTFKGGLQLLHEADAVKWLEPTVTTAVPLHGYCSLVLLVYSSISYQNEALGMRMGIEMRGK